MRITVFLLIFSVVQVMGGNSYSQNTRLSLNFKNVAIEKVLDEIENQSEFYFLFNQKLVNVDRKVDIDVKNKRIKDILAGLFASEDINCLVMDRQILLSPKYITERVNVTRDRQPQEIVVTGKVTDEDGNPLPGVNIVIMGKITGTITDVDGNYTLDVDDPEAVLVFTFIGMLTQEIKVGDQTEINITMARDVIGLKEVVAIGYGTVKKSDLTGSVASIKYEDLNQGAISSIDQAMQGQIAGVQVTQASSEPGGGLSIRIRGASSVNAGNEPLYVIDGLPIDNSPGLSGTSATEQVAHVSSNLNIKNPLNSLNPNDIESIEILKDASAAAIYGSRGANGVVLITTKKGSGRIKFNYNGYGGYQSVAKKIDILETDEYIEAINAISTEMGNGPIFSAADIAQIGDGINWQDEIYQVAPVQSHNLSMSGGVQKTRFYVSLNYFDQQGVVKETGTKRYIARINVNQEIG